MKAKWSDSIEHNDQIEQDIIMYGSAWVKCFIDPATGYITHLRIDPKTINEKFIKEQLKSD